MRSAESDEHAAYRQYRAEIQRDVMAPSLHNGVWVVVALNLIFIPFDYLGFPEKLWTFVIVRLVTIAILLAIGRWGADRWPIGASLLGCFVTGGSLLWVIYGAGGATSEYSPGLMLLFVGMPVLLPFSASQAAMISGTLFVAYAASPWVMDTPVEWREYVLRVCFPLAAALESVASTAAVDRIRFRDFKQRAELQRARDDLKALDREKSRFTANVHHELRTPLTLMLAPLEAMLGGEFGAFSDGQRSYLRTMHSNALRLLKLINNLLDLAKIEGKQLAIRRRPTQLGTRGRGSDQRRAAAGRAQGRRPRARGFDSLPVVNLDPDALEKVIVNLVGNSLKFTERAGGSRCGGRRSRRAAIELVVADTGMGLPPDQLERIFDRFAQVDSSNTRRHEGTGIGLALVKELVELHGGRVWAESEGVGHGSSFHVVLPAGELDAEEQEQLLETPLGPHGDAREHARGHGRGDRVRCAGAGRSAAHGGDGAHGGAHGVRGEPGASWCRARRAPSRPMRPRCSWSRTTPTCGACSSIWSGASSACAPRATGARGSKPRARAHPDLVLTDVMMPEMSGTELCEAIKTDPATRGDSGRARHVEGRARDEDRGARARRRRLRDEALPPARAAGARALARAAAAPPGGARDPQRAAREHERRAREHARGAARKPASSSCRPSGSPRWASSRPASRTR